MAREHIREGSQGWAGMADNNPQILKRNEDIAEYNKRLMEQAQDFKVAFSTPQGANALRKIEAFVYGRPLIEEGPNISELALVRGGMREVVEFIQMQMIIAEQGVPNV
jgi:hypothetical protein